MPAKQVFELPYIGIDKTGSYELLVGKEGEYSIVIAISNPVIRYSASPAAYDEFHQLMINIVKVLGDNYILQKLDIISRSVYPDKPANEYLQKHYNAHFSGRDYLDVKTYLTITRPSKKGAFYVYDPKALFNFRQAIGKVTDILAASGTSPKVLREAEINDLVMRMLAMDFSASSIALNNYQPTDTEIKMGDRSVRCITLINTDNIDLPQEVGTHIELNEKETLRGFPVDFLSFLFRVPDFDVLVFNQVIEIPGQTMQLKKLELKKKRHSGIPDPANTLCVEDIDLLLNNVARENQLLVNCHFTILITAANDQLQKATNFIESSLFGLGIIPSKNAYNQLELFRSALPGNAVELKSYDWFLTTCDAAICFCLKETMPKGYTCRYRCGRSADADKPDQ
jgi:hypothetical protein